MCTTHQEAVPSRRGRRYPMLSGWLGPLFLWCLLVGANPASSQDREEGELGDLVHRGDVVAGFLGSGKGVGLLGVLVLGSRSDHSLEIEIPPFLLVPANGATQDCAAPFSSSVSIEAGKTVRVPIRGVCVVPSREPLGKGESCAGHLLAAGGNIIPLEELDSTGSFQDEDEVRPPGTRSYTVEETDVVLERTARYFAAAEKLQEDGALEDVPYDDSEVRVEVVVQWSVWQDEEISEVTEEERRAKSDLADTIREQVEEKRDEGVELTGEQETRVDEGIDAIWAAVDLTAKTVAGE